jgi:hypothetical protein
MMTLRTRLGGKAKRESAVAAAYVRSQGHLCLRPTLFGRPSFHGNSDWSAPGS